MGRPVSSAVMDDALTIDQWSGLDHKDLTLVSGVPEYLADEDKRRLVAYRALSAYIETVSRNLLPEDEDHDPEEWQEFGDVGVLVERVAAGVLGDDPSVWVVGAGLEIPETPELPDFPAPLPEGLEAEETTVRTRIRTIAVTRWREQVDAILEAWEGQIAAAGPLAARQEWLEQWAEDDRFIAKLREAESEYIVGLGDAAIVCGWDAANRRPSTELLEPDAYIPVLDTRNAPFPSKVHLVFQFDDPDPDEDRKLVRVITYELVDLEGLEASSGAAARPAYLAGNDLHTQTCLLSDGTWELDDIENILDVTANPLYWEKIAGPGGEGDEIDLNNYNTGYDFIPVVHLPNTLSTSGHFGRSILTRTLQLLDEIHAVDADISLSARWAAQPPVAIAGLPASTTVIDFSPGAGIRGDKVETVDMAQNLEQLVALADKHQKRLSTNMQIPDGIRGRVEDEKAVSGVARVVSFTPFVQLILTKLRPARQAKLPLILKFVQRIAIINRAESGIENDTVYPAEVRFGAFMPQDQQAAVAIVTDLIGSGAISVRTGMMMLAEVGIPIEDIDAELAAVRSVDAERAVQFADAVGPKYAADYLEIDDYEDGDSAGDEGDAGPAPIIDDDPAAL